MKKQRAQRFAAVMATGLIVGLCCGAASEVLAIASPTRAKGCPKSVSAAQLMQTMKMQGTKLRTKPGTMIQLGKTYSDSFFCQLHQ